MSMYVLGFALGLSAPHIPRNTMDPTLEQARAWLIHLPTNRELDEELLERGLARRIEHEFERHLENYAVYLQRRRSMFDAGKPAGLSLRAIEVLRQFTKPSLKEMKKRRDYLVAWREVAELLL